MNRRKDCISSILNFVAKPPKVTSQPTNHKNVLPGNDVEFSVKGTGTKPLSYQWQWKPYGKESERVEWQNLSAVGNTLQVVKVQTSNAGYYRCVVSNSAGSETSQCASLTVGKPVKPTLA